MSEKTREEILDLLRRCNPRTRKTVLRVIEGKVSQDNAAFIQEQLSFIEPDMTVRTVDFVSSRLCDAGHALDQQNRLLGICQHNNCSANVCSHPGCGYTCRCGRLFCHRHVRVYGDEAYCSRCYPAALLRWLILGKRK